ncbi:hypothetical protein M405DRAFT_741309, partial [Rhizopogon salebrosus TDB-379]
LLVLFYDQAGELRVLLTTRSKSLRANPWQAALPGGNADEEGESLVWTAVSNRSLIIRHSSASTKQMKLLSLSPPTSSNIHFVTTLPLLVFASLGDVSPLLHTILKSLTPSLTEVDRIFDHPVEAVLDPQLLLKNGELLVGEGEDWPYNARELHNTTDFRPEALDGLIYSMHRSRTCASPIKGLTTDILVRHI